MGASARKLLRFYTTYPLVGRLESTRGFDKEQPHRYRLLCSFADQEVDATIVSDAIDQTVAHVTSEERVLKTRMLDARDHQTNVAIGRLLAERALPLRVTRVWYGGSVERLRNLRYRYIFDRLSGIFEGLTSSGITMDVHVEGVLSGAATGDEQRVLYSFLLPLKSMPNLRLITPDGSIETSTPER